MKTLNQLLNSKKCYVSEPGVTMSCWEGDNHVPDTDARLADLPATAQSVARQYEVALYKKGEELSVIYDELVEARTQLIPWYKRRFRRVRAWLWDITVTARDWTIHRLGGYTGDDL